MTIGQTASDADFNGNNRVDFFDFILFAGEYGSQKVRFDLNGSGRVDFGDFLIFAKLYGQEIELAGGPTISGKLLDALGQGLYGTVVRTDSDSVLTDSEGAFEVPADTSGSTALEVLAPGYKAEMLEVAVADSDTTLAPTVLESRNAERLAAAAAASNSDSSGIAAVVQEAGFHVNEDPETNQGFAGSHLNGLARLEQAEKRMSLDEIAEELALMGLTFNGHPITGNDLVEILQALVDAAFSNPEDLRGFLPLQLFSDPDGSLPETPPKLTPDTLLDPTPAMTLLTAARLAAEHTANLPPETEVPTEGDLESWISQYWRDVPLGQGQIDGVSSVADSTSLALLGLQLGLSLAGDLRVDGEQEPVIPYQVGGQTVQREGLGGVAANLIYKLTTNSVGEPLTDAGVEGISLASGGEIDTPSGPIVPVADHRIAGGERKPRFEGLAGYGISSRFRVDARHLPGGVGAYGISPPFTVDIGGSPGA